MLKGTNLKLTGITKGTGLYTPSATTDAGCTAMVVANATSTSIIQNRSYMLTSDINDETEIYFATEDFMTGVNDIEESKEDGVLYELNGVRADKLQNGRIYVTSSGKTILVK
jgi:hypothetical protein